MNVGVKYIETPYNRTGRQTSQKLMPLALQKQYFSAFYKYNNNNNLGLKKIWFPPDRDADS